MPIYEYSCQKCGAHLEVMQRITDKPLARHSKCGGRLTKEWSQTSFQLKGSGWYVTDYAGKKQEAKETKETKSDPKETKSAPAESKKTADAGSKGTEAASSPAAGGGD